MEIEKGFGKVKGMSVIQNVPIMMWRAFQQKFTMPLAEAFKYSKRASPIPYPSQFISFVYV